MDAVTGYKRRTCAHCHGAWTPYGTPRYIGYGTNGRHCWDCAWILTARVPWKKAR